MRARLAAYASPWGTMMRWLLVLLAGAALNGWRWLASSLAAPGTLQRVGLGVAALVVLLLAGLLLRGWRAGFGQPERAVLIAALLLLLLSWMAGVALSP